MLKPDVWNVLSPIVAVVNTSIGEVKEEDKLRPDGQLKISTSVAGPMLLRCRPKISPVTVPATFGGVEFVEVNEKK
jgi:hypothetical protein